MKTVAPLAILGAASATRASQLTHERGAGGLVGRAAGGVLVKTYGTPYADYMVNATAGTPPQNLSLIVAPSAPYTWVPEAGGYYCDSEFARERYCPWGSFARNASSSFAQNRSESSFYADGADESDATGEWFTDALGLPGGVALPKLAMGLADDAQRFLGTLGLAFNDSDHDGVADAMVRQGLIPTAAYSIWLDANDRAASGNLLFGAVDMAKFSGNLVRLEAYMYSPVHLNVAVSLYTVLTSNYAIPDDVAPAFPMSMALSHSSPVCSFPTAVAKEIWRLAGATYDASSRAAVIPCSNARDTSRGTLNFRFEGPDGPVLEVPFSDLVLSADFTPALGWDSDALGNTTEWCLFGVQNGTFAWGSGGAFTSTSSAYSNLYTLGSPVLRRAYTVVDLVNQQVALAPVKFGVKESSVVAFEQYGARMPNSERYCLDENFCESGYGPNGGWPTESVGVHRPVAPIIIVAVGTIVGAKLILVAVIATLILTKKGILWREEEGCRGSGARDGAGHEPGDDDDVGGGRCRTEHATWRKFSCGGCSSGR